MFRLPSVLFNGWLDLNTFFSLFSLSTACQSDGECLSQRNTPTHSHKEPVVSAELSPDRENFSRAEFCKLLFTRSPTDSSAWRREILETLIYLQKATET